LPKEPGVYFFLDKEHKILYVGKAKNLKQRVSSYFVHKTDLGEKTRLLVSKIKYIQTIQVTSEIESLLLEANLIKKYIPPYNVRFTDGKGYPFIRITTKNEYPAVCVSRKTNDPNSFYFGPYPNVGAMRLVLKTIRKIFPFQSAVNHGKRTCLYYHLGLCPCASASNSQEAKRSYKKTIRYIRTFLEGNVRKVVRDLEQERESLSIKELYEEAKDIQKKIDAITLITSPVHRPFEYETNPNLASDLRKKDLDSLQEELSRVGVFIKSLGRIECYDISNISGTNAVGSMIVFSNGEKNTSEYRRFKIRRADGPNDFAMMQEILQRRLKHAEWPFPDLLVVDGGKGQISSALKVLDKQHLSIPLIGLAKREEIIITSDFKEIKLPKDSDALHLVMRIRDEAHCFAIAYHRKLRSKSAIIGQ